MKCSKHWTSAYNPCPMCGFECLECTSTQNANNACNVDTQAAREIFEELEKKTSYGNRFIKIEISWEDYLKIKEKYLHRQETPVRIGQADEYARNNQPSSSGLRMPDVQNHNRAADSSELCVNNSQSSVPDANTKTHIRNILTRIIHELDDIAYLLEDLELKKETGA